MAQGQRLTDEQIETIRAAYVAADGVVADAARVVGFSEATVRKYGPAPDDDFASLRAQKKGEIIDRVSDDVAAKFVAVRSAYLAHLMRPDVVAATSARDAVVVVGTITDKHQLVTGAATARTETGPPDSGRFTLDEIEKLAAVAERVKSGVS